MYLVSYLFSLFYEVNLVIFGHNRYHVCLQNYLLCDEDIGGRKSEKAKELGFVFSLKCHFSFHATLWLFSNITFLQIALCFLRRMDCLTRSVHQKNQRQHKNQRNLKMKFVLLQKKKVCKSQK